VAVAVNVTAAALVLTQLVVAVTPMLTESTGFTVTVAVAELEQPAAPLATTVTAWVCAAVVGAYVKVAHPSVEVAVAKAVPPSENTYEVAPVTEAQIVVTPAQFGPVTVGVNDGNVEAVMTVDTSDVHPSPKFTLAVYVVVAVVVTVKVAQAVVVWLCAPRVTVLVAAPPVVHTRRVETPPQVGVQSPVQVISALRLTTQICCQWHFDLLMSACVIFSQTRLESFGVCQLMAAHGPVGQSVLPLLAVGVGLPKHTRPAPHTQFAMVTVAV